MEVNGDLGDALDATPWVWPDSRVIRASEVAVELTVLARAERTDRDPSRHRPDDWAGREPGLSPLDEIDAARYELPTATENRQPLRWEQVVRRPRARLAVKGAPGSGKTFMTRHTVAELARRAKAELDAQQVSAQETPAAVWVTATALAQADARMPEDALIDALAQSTHLTIGDRARRWLHDAITAPRALIVVDALDELRQEDVARFTERVVWLHGLPGRVIVTCRTLQWEQRRHDLAWPRVTEVELAPLARRQQRAIVQKVFTGDPVRAQRLHVLLQANGAIRHACTTPLRLMFACLLHRDGTLSEATTYAQLYAHLVRQLVVGAWRGKKPSWARSSVQTARVLRRLEGVTWQLFRAAPDVNRFTLAAWERSAIVSGLATHAADRLLEKLVAVGLLVEAGFDDAGDQCWSFAHRTILEFLAARALARRPQEEWLAEAKQHFWFEPAWLEVLTFLAGLVGDATPLIEGVGREQERDDVFGSMLALKARLLASASRVDRLLLVRTREDVVAFFVSTIDGRRAHLHEFSARMLHSLGALCMENEVRDWLLGGLEHINWEMRKATANALGILGNGSAVDRLLGMLQNTTEYDQVRWAAVQTLGTIGNDRAVKPLLDAVLHDRSLVSRAAAKALSAVGADRVVDPLLDVLQDQAKSEDVRWMAAQILGTLGNERALVPLLAALFDQSVLVRRAAAEALGSLGNDRATGPLLAALGDQETEVVITAAAALGTLGSDHALEFILSAQHNANYDIRCTAARALGAYGSDRAVETLIGALSDSEPSVRWCAAAALGDLRSERAIEALLASLKDADPEVRWQAARALCGLASERVVDPLLAILRDPVYLVRTFAAVALGNSRSKRAEAPLIALLNDPMLQVRNAAAGALGELGSALGIGPLQRAMKSGSVNWWHGVRALYRIAWTHRVAIYIA
jgi:HEAT repeat protein/type II secretory pathway predicted ATPase ExeA